MLFVIRMSKNRFISGGLIMFLYLMILLLVFYGIKAKSNFDNNQPLDKNTCIALKGVLCLCILVHHLADNYLPVYLVTFNKVLGGIVVGVFFMLSGYGLTISLKNKGINYLKKIVFVKIPKLYLLNCLVNIIIYLLTATESALGFKVSFHILFLNDLKLQFELVNAYSWYITMTIYLYGIFAIVAFSWHKFKLNKIFIPIILFILSILFYSTYPHFTKVIYTRGNLCFPLGVLYALYSKEINIVLKKYWNLIMTTMLGLIIIYFMVGVPPIILSGEQYLAIMVCILIVTFAQKFILANRISLFLGKYSLQIYLLQGIPPIVFANYFKFNSGTIIYLYIIIVIDIIIGISFAKFLNYLKYIGNN